MTPERIPDGFQFRARYDFTCSNCGHEMQFEPSVFMTDFALNLGFKTCTKCGQRLRLEIDVNNNLGVAVPFGPPRLTLLDISETPKDVISQGSDT